MWKPRDPDLFHLGVPLFLGVTQASASSRQVGDQGLCFSIVCALKHHTSPLLSSHWPELVPWTTQTQSYLKMDSLTEKHLSTTTWCYKRKKSQVNRQVLYPWGDNVGRGGNPQTTDPLPVTSSSCFILYPSRKALVSWENHLLRSLTR